MAGLHSSPLAKLVSSDADGRPLDERQSLVPLPRRRSTSPARIADPKVCAAIDAVLVESSGQDIEIKRAELETSYLTLSENDQNERDAYLERGRIFASLWQRLTRNEYNRFVESRTLVPLGAKAALKLRHIVERMAQRGVPRDAMPATWTVAYALMSLKTKEFERAQEEGLVRPDLSMAEIREFRKWLGKMKPIVTGKSIDEIERLRAERDGLSEEIRKLRSDVSRKMKRLRLLDLQIATEVEET
jgi:hypothetical protein